MFPVHNFPKWDYNTFLKIQIMMKRWLHHNVDNGSTRCKAGCKLDQRQSLKIQEMGAHCFCLFLSFPTFAIFLIMVTDGTECVRLNLDIWMGAFLCEWVIKHFSMDFLASEFKFSKWQLFWLQMELHRLLPFFHDDLPDSLRRVDWAPVGLHAHSETRGQFHNNNNNDHHGHEDEDNWRSL